MTFTLTCACQFFWTPCSDEEDVAEFSCAASMTTSPAYEHWPCPFSYLERKLYDWNKTLILLQVHTETTTTCSFYKQSLTFTHCLIKQLLATLLVKANLGKDNDNLTTHHNPCDVPCGVPVCSCGSVHGNEQSQVFWWSVHPLPIFVSAGL